MVRLDPAKLDRHLLRRGWTKERLALEADVARTTVFSVLRGNAVFIRTAKRIADALESEISELTVTERTESDRDYSMPGTEEWECIQPLTAWNEAANGLQYRMCRMQHRFDPSRQGRGKFYDIKHVPEQRRIKMRHYLLRHSTVCSRVNPHPNIIDHFSCVLSENSEWCWVIDRWIDAAPLSELIRDNSLSGRLVPGVCQDVLTGLTRLHDCEIVFRELSPSRILVDPESGHVVLTDFELAKLLGDAPSVSADWADDAYRAPEVDGGVCSVSADYYSWARILLQLTMRNLPEPGMDQDLLLRAGLPKSLWKLVSNCLSPIHTDRPRNANALQKALARWKIQND